MRHSGCGDERKTRRRTGRLKPEKGSDDEGMAVKWRRGDDGVTTE